MGYGCLLDFAVCCQLIRHARLIIRFLFVRLRFCYPFFSPTPHSANLGSRYRVRRQLRPLWTFTTDWRLARHTTKKLTAFQPSTSLPLTGLEPVRVKNPTDFKSVMSANSITAATPSRKGSDDTLWDADYNTISKFSCQEFHWK